MESNQSNPITVKTTVNAPIAKVWECWTKPEHITQWSHASDDWHAPYAENDLSKNGKFKTTLAAKDGSVSFDFEGVYIDIQPHQIIEYIMADQRKVKIIFKEEGNQTHITETFDPENENPREMQQGGWQAFLDNFKKYTESQ